MRAEIRRSHAVDIQMGVNITGTYSSQAPQVALRPLPEARRRCGTRNGLHCLIQGLRERPIADWQEERRHMS